MEHKSDLAKRTAAFQTLLRDVGEQLGKQNADDIEFFEGIPQDERGKGGIKLLEYLRNRGRFTQWKIEPLREILRKCNRCDLADTLVKKYQLNFVDRDSPQAPRLIIEHVAGNSPLLSSHTSLKRSSSSPISSWQTDIENHPTSLLPPSILPQEEVAIASSHCMSGSLPSECRGFTMSGSPSHLRQRSAECLLPVQEGSLSATSLSRRDSYADERSGISISNPHLPHMHPRRSCCGDNRYELANTAIRAMLEIVTHTNRTPSCVSIHSDNSCDSETTILNSSTSFDEGIFPRKLVMANEELGEKTKPKLTRRASSPASNRRPSGDSPQASHTLSYPGTITEGQRSDYVSSQVNKTLPCPVKEPRSLSVYCKQPLDNFRWLVKHEHLLKSISKPQETKFQAIVCSRKLNLDVGEGKYNPKLSLILYPNGLFTNKGTSASLQAKIVTPDKCPPLPPSLLVQLNVTVSGSDGFDVWKEACVQETVNTYSFYIHNLFTCKAVREDCKGEYIHLSISVLIQKAMEH